MFIEDEELRSLYQAASEDHLNTIESGLLHLEKSPQDKAQLTSLLRALHSLKGDSRMLGVEAVESLVHQMENLLSAVEQGKQAFTSDLCDRLYIGLDAVRRVAHEAITGQASNVSIFHIMAELMGTTDETVPPAPDTQPALSIEDELETVLANLNSSSSSISATKTLAPEIAPETLDASRPLDVLTSGIETAVIDPESDPESAAPATIDTIRVKAHTLDGLMTQADELSIAKLRIAQRVEDVTQLLDFWEEWSRDTTKWKHQQANSAEALQKFFELNSQRLQQLGNLLSQVRAQSTEDTNRLEAVANGLESGLRKLRLMPLSSIFNLFPRMIRDISKQQHKEIRFEIEGGDILVDKKILEEIKDPLTHLLRNAVDHGIEPTSERLENGKAALASLCLRGTSVGDQLVIEVLDDGRGIDIAAIRQTALRKGLHTEAELDMMPSTQIQSLIFAAGFSTRTTVTELSGRGMGLDVVRDNVERLKGTIEVESTANKGSTFRLCVSSNLATTHALIVSVNQIPYAIPLDAIETMLRVSRQDLFNVEGTPNLTWKDRPIQVAWLADLLELPVQSPASVMAEDQHSTLSCVILKVGKRYLAVMVDTLLDQQMLVLKPQSKLLKRVRNVMGATLLGSGEICMVLNPQDLLKSAFKGKGVASLTEHFMEVRAKTRVLLVEDSIPIRTQVKRILEGAGFDVTTAVDGLDGFNKIRTRGFDAVVSDVEMPNMTGLELTSRIRQYDEFEELPIILVTTLAKEEDKRRGADAGANAYLTKGDFDQSLLIQTLRRLVD
jgi:two-component system, chemotaxis family, sensor kinase CheA